MPFMGDPWDGYEKVGGHLVLDFVNTVSWRRDSTRTLDRLADPAFRTWWLAGSDLPPEATVEGLVKLRDTVFRLLTENDPRPRDLARFKRELQTAYRRARLVPPLPLHWEPGRDQPAEHALALAAGELLRSPDTEFLRECSGEGCAWLFLDRSRNRSRRWCSSADCGNRARARRHYARWR